MMGVFQINIIVGAVATFAIVGCAGAPSADSRPAVLDGNLELHASGGGNWDIDCVAVTNRGQAKSGLKGRGSNSTDMLFIRDVSDADCSYQTGDSAVTLKLMEEGLACPFGEFQGGLCQTVLPAETSGTLQFSLQ